jgi:N-dimethylarginine dimethylaminohydrolase
MIVRRVSDLPADWTLAGAPRMPLPSEVLLCSPQFFEVRDVKNAFMSGRIGTVNSTAALAQWQTLRATFESCGVTTHAVAALPQCEDMVFTANASFNGRRAGGTRICVPSRMAFASRQPEVEVHRTWFAAHGYRIVELPPSVERFEGAGDALWHPGRALIWAGTGPRTVSAAQEALAQIFEVPVFALEPSDPRFYHLDTCFCAVSERTAIVFPQAFTEESMALVRRVFEDVIEVDEAEAELFACNAAAFFGKVVVIQRGASRTIAALRERGFDVREVETAEFMKSGGSVFCMKAELR